MDSVQHLVRFMGKTDGRDKLAKMLQNYCK
jgi:hypothetical protein